MTDEKLHMLVAKFEEISAGEILPFESRQIFGHEFPEEFPFFQILGAQ